MKLREYQRRSVDELYEWFGKNDGNPALCLPTGSGKSVIIATIVQEALQNWPETRVLMLVHSRELVQQNADKLLALWPGAPLGIYAASLKKRQLAEPITFASIQSVFRRGQDIGHIDLCIVDECHAISNEETGSYRKLLSELLQINPAMRVIGLSASPYRLGQGLITQGKEAIFSQILEPVSIEELVYSGFLAPLRSKHTETQIDVTGVAKRGGEFVAADLERAVDQAGLNNMIVQETLARASHCQSILFFCAGVDHANHMRDALEQAGVRAECVTGKTPAADRVRILEDFKAGRLRALTNANVLTTGFDAPDTDCIVMARPTMSPGLYVQMAGRGMRLKRHTDCCLVLDFAGNVRRHGPITAVQPPEVARKGGDAPTRTCPECGEIAHAAVRFCPGCGYEFPAPAAVSKDPPRLHNDDIMGIDPIEMPVANWRWRKHVSRASGKEMLTVTYYSPVGQSVLEYLPITHDGAFGARVRALVVNLAQKAGVDQVFRVPDLEKIAETLSAGKPPAQIKYVREGKFYKVLGRTF